MSKPIHYEAFKELFYELGINPKEFRDLSGDRVRGYFPDLPERKTTVNVKKLAKVLWGKKWF